MHKQSIVNATFICLYNRQLSYVLQKHDLQREHKKSLYNRFFLAMLNKLKPVLGVRRETARRILRKVCLSSFVMFEHVLSTSKSI